MVYGSAQIGVIARVDQDDLGTVGVHVLGHGVDGVRQPDARFAVQRQADLLEQCIVAGDRDDIDTHRRSRSNIMRAPRCRLGTRSDGRRGHRTLLLATGIGERRPPYPVTCGV